MFDLLFPDGHLVVGLEDDADGSLRVYVDQRSTGIHSHVADPDAKTRIRGAWSSSRMGHLTTQIPRDALCDCPPSTKEA